jgi:hypothetical protein
MLTGTDEGSFAEVSIAHQTTIMAISLNVLQD